VVAAPTDSEARWLFTSLQQAFLWLRSGRPGRLPPPVDGFYENLMPSERWMLDEVLASAVVGSPESVRRELDAFVARTHADDSGWSPRRSSTRPRVCVRSRSRPPCAGTACLGALGSSRGS